MEEAEFSGSFLFSGWRVCLWRGEEWRDGSPIAPLRCTAGMRRVQ